MKNTETTSIPGGGKLVTAGAPDREKSVPNMNKAMPSGFAGGPRDMSSTMDGNKPPRAKSGD